MYVKVTGLKEVQNYLTKLPRSEKENGKEGAYKASLSMQRRTRRRYSMQGYGTSQWSSGRGYKSIKAKRTEKGGILRVGDSQTSDYLDILEKGFSIHQVSLGVLEEHRRQPGSTVGQTAQDLGVRPRGYVTVHWRGPFIQPALKNLRRDIPNIIHPYVKKSIRGI